MKDHMDDSKRLITAMAEKCRSLVAAWVKPDLRLPKALQRRHLVWMCDQISEHAEDVRATKLNRWIGFVQCAMLANRMLDLDGLKVMFDEVKRAHGKLTANTALVCGQEEFNEDSEDLMEQLDPTSSFEFDLGGDDPH